MNHTQRYKVTVQLDDKARFRRALRQLVHDGHLILTDSSESATQVHAWVVFPRSASSLQDLLFSMERFEIVEVEEA